MVFQCSIKMNPCYLMTLKLVCGSVLFMKKNLQHKSIDAPTQLINVLCLEKTLGINTPQRFKKSSFHVEKVYRTEIGYGNIEIHFIDSFVKSHW